MSYFASELTKTLRRYDRDLFAVKSADGSCRVYRKVRVCIPVCEWQTEDGERVVINKLADKRQFVLALTDNWSMKGQPRAWGSDDVLDKLKQMDLQANERWLEQFEAQEERERASKERAQQTEDEAYASHYRRAIAKATDDLLVRHRWKDEPTKRKKDRSLKNGNR